MNWYQKDKMHRLAKMVRDMAVNENFEQDIEEIHELEYKAYKVEVSQTFTHPKRKENILNIIHDKAWDYFENLRQDMERAFENWQGNHPIQSADAWADMVFETLMEGFRDEHEFIEYCLNDGIMWGQMHFAPKDLIKHIDPKDIAQVVRDDVYNYPDNYEYEIRQYLEEIQPNWGTDEDKEDEEKVVEYFRDNIDATDFANYYAKYMIEMGDYEVFSQFLSLSAIIKAIEKELYPAYMRMWGPSIKDINKNIKKAVNRLDAINYDSSIKDMTTAVSLAMNVMHVGGNIGSDYLGYSTNFLDEMRDRETDDWDKEVSKEFGL